MVADLFKEVNEKQILSKGWNKRDMKNLVVECVPKKLPKAFMFGRKEVLEV